MAELNCLAGSGAILYSPDNNYGTSGGGYGYSSGGGISGGGSVWSDSGQIIWISVNGAPKYPVWLKPGWNEVHFWIPFIFPDDEWVEAPIIIEAPGYILIPAGFEFSIKTDEDAPVQTGNPKMVDKLQFIDVYDYDIQSVPVPVELDGIFDELVFEDTHSIDIIAISSIVDEACIENLTIEDTHSIDIIAISSIVDEACIENLTIEDINDYDIQGAPISREVEHVDEIVFNDVTKTELINTTILNSNNIEDISFTDITKTELINTTILNSNNIEDISFTDINSNNTKSVAISNQLESENLGFDDFVKIEKN